jgi:hypothetical protein
MQISCDFAPFSAAIIGFIRMNEEIFSKIKSDFTSFFCDSSHFFDVNRQFSPHSLILLRPLRDTSVPRYFLRPFRPYYTPIALQNYCFFLNCANKLQEKCSKGVVKPIRANTLTAF